MTEINIAGSSPELELGSQPVTAWVLIPARGGSVGIPRKNLRVLAGRPMLAYSIAAARAVLPKERVIVVTDDEEIALTARREGAEVIFESMPTPGGETLDTKIVRNLDELERRGAGPEDPVVTVQPTSPLLQPETIAGAIAQFTDPATGSVLSVADDRHLRWSRNKAGQARPLFAARVNRQELPEEFRETGGIIAARLRDIRRTGTRIVEPVHLIPLAEDEAIDIDTYSDLYAAAHLLTRKRIAIRVDASRALGMGHVYRMLALAAELARHDIIIYLSESMPLGQELFSQYPYRTRSVADEDEFQTCIEQFQPDLVVLDVLDTDAAELRALRAAAPSAKIISFEDRGRGAEEADLLVAEFIENDRVPAHRQLAGIEYALLAPPFEHSRRFHVETGPEVREILVVFGGTDPAMLGQRALESLARVGYSGNVTAVRGLGAEPLQINAEWPFALRVLDNVKNMAALMHGMDLAFTSAGRTIVELVSQCVPAICIAQNEKELTHTHAVAEHGIVALGLGAALGDAELDAATHKLLTDVDERAALARSAASAGARRSNRRTISTILHRVGFEDFPEI